MNKEELGKLYPITVVPYDPNWPEVFETEKEIIVNILSPEIALRVEHIGSTAVPYLSSKPTIDILVEIPNLAEFKELLLDKMTRINYLLMKEEMNHIVFAKGYAAYGLEKISYHVYMGSKEQDSLWERLLFRDFLRVNPQFFKQYEQLKLELAETYKHDREAYTVSKSEFIRRITCLAKNS